MLCIFLLVVSILFLYEPSAIEKFDLSFFRNDLRKVLIYCPETSY